MKIKNTTCKLDTNKIEQSLAILQKEQQVNMISRWQKISYILFNLSIYVFVISFILMTVLSIYYKGKPAGIWLTVMYSLAALFFISAVLIPILFFLNIPLIRKIWHQIKLVRRLGLYEVFKVPWQAEKRKKRFLNILTLIIACLGLLIILYVMIYILRIIEIAMHRNGHLYLITFLILIIIGMAFITLHFMRRNKRRLEVTARLQSYFVNYMDEAREDEDQQIDIPTEDYRQIAQIERAQINRDRFESIITSTDESDFSLYSVQKSRSAREVKSQLDPDIKLKIDAELEDLAMEPRPPEAKEDPKDEIWQLRLKEAPVEISYTIDEDNRIIKIFTLKLITGDPSSNSNHGG